MDLLWLLPLVFVLALISGVYYKLNSVSLSLILIPGMLGFESLLPVSVEDSLLILIASCLAASLPFCVLSFVSAAKNFKGDFEVVSRFATRVSLSSILIAQILGIVPSIYVYSFYCILLALFAMSLILGPYLNREKYFQESFSGRFWYLSLLSLPLGAAGTEWRKVLPIKSNTEGFDYFSTLSMFVVFPALLGFVFPALPVTVFESQQWQQNWMIGYICWPLSILVFCGSYIGNALVKNTQNQTDKAWLHYILALFLLAIVIRSIIT